MTQEAEKHQGLRAAQDQAEQEKDHERQLRWGYLGTRPWVMLGVLLTLIEVIFWC